MAYLGFHPISPIFTYFHLHYILKKGFNLFALILDTTVWMDEAENIDVLLDAQDSWVVSKGVDCSVLRMCRVLY